jgi:hypothetical protein
MPDVFDGEANLLAAPHLSHYPLPLSTHTYVVAGMYCLCHIQTSGTLKGNLFGTASQ